MKKSIVLLLLSLSIFFLFLGIFVGAYNIFPYSELNSIKNQIKPESVINAKPSDTLNINNLISIKGVGQWTVHMFLMFSMGSPDIFPSGDLGVIKAISSS